MQNVEFRKTPGYHLVIKKDLNNLIALIYALDLFNIQVDTFNASDEYVYISFWNCPGGLKYKAVQVYIETYIEDQSKN